MQNPHKNSSEITFMRKILSEVDFFKKNSHLLEEESTMKYLLESVNLEHFSKNSCLFKKGDIGTEFFIVLKG